jgi:hypothetical protein
MKGAIAAVEIYLIEDGERAQRLSLAIAAPERNAAGEGWSCRVVLANLHRPVTVVGRDSVEALSLALEHARSWVAALRSEGRVLTRDSDGHVPFEWP